MEKAAWFDILIKPSAATEEHDPVWNPQLESPIEKVLNHPNAKYSSNMYV